MISLKTLLYILSVVRAIYYITEQKIIVTSPEKLNIIKCIGGLDNRAYT